MMDSEASKRPPHLQIILDRMGEVGHDLKSLSKLIGRNDSYIHQYVYYDKPRKLDGDDRQVIARALQVSERELTSPALPKRLAGNPERILTVASKNPPEVATDETSLAPPLQLTNALATLSQDGRVMLHLFRGNLLAMRIALPRSEARDLAAQINLMDQTR